MKQSIAVLSMVLFLAITSIATAKTIKCSVVSIEGDELTLQCTSMDELQVGDTVKIKTAKKKAIEGC